MNKFLKFVCLIFLSFFINQTICKAEFNVDYVVADKKGNTILELPHNYYFLENKFDNNEFLVISFDNPLSKIYEVKDKKFKFEDKYKEFYILSKALYYVIDFKDNEYIIDKSGKILLKINEYNKIQRHIDGDGNIILIKDFPYPIRKDYRVYRYDYLTIDPYHSNIYNNNFEKIYEGIISSVFDFDDDNILIVKDNYKDGLVINSKGEIIIDHVIDLFDMPCNCYKFDEILDTFGKVYKINKDGKNYIVNKHKELIVPFSVDNYLFLKNNTALFLVNNKWGLYDLRKQKWIFSPKFDDIPNISKYYRIIPIKKDNSNDTLNYLCNKKFKPYEPNTNFCEIYPSNKKGCLFLAIDEDIKNKFLLDKKSKMLYKTKFDEYIVATDFKYIVSREKGKEALLDFNGKVLLPFEYDYIFLYKNSIFSKKENIYELYDKNLNLIKTFGTEYKVINKDDLGNTILVKSKDNNSFTLFDINSGKELLSYPYIKKLFKQNLFIIKNKNDKYGLVTSKNKFVIPAIYDDLKISRIINDDKITKAIAVKKDNKWGILSLNNKVLYDNIFEYRPVEIIYDFVILKK